MVNELKKRVAGIIFWWDCSQGGLALGGIIPATSMACHLTVQATQSATALNGIAISWSVPIVLAIVGMWVISKYPLSDAEVDKINHEIEDRRQAEEK